MGKVNLDGVDSKEELEERILEEAMKVAKRIKRRSKEEEFKKS